MERVILGNIRAKIPHVEVLAIKGNLIQKSSLNICPKQTQIIMNIPKRWDHLTMLSG